MPKLDCQRITKIIYTLSLFCSNRHYSSQSKSKSMLSVKLILLYITGIPREIKDSLCWVRDYLHEPMTFAPWNSSGAPLCVVTTNT